MLMMSLYPFGRMNKAVFPQCNTYTVNKAVRERLKRTGQPYFVILMKLRMLMLGDSAQCFSRFIHIYFSDCQISNGKNPN